MASALQKVLGSSWATMDGGELLQVAVVACLFFVSVKALQLYFRRKKLIKAFAQFPGPPSHWLLGNVHEFRRDGTDLDILVAWTKKYQYAYPVWFGGFSTFLFIVHPDYAKAMLGRGVLAGCHHSKWLPGSFRSCTFGVLIRHDVCMDTCHLSTVPDIKIC